MDEMENDRNSINFIEEEEKEMALNTEEKRAKEIEAHGTDYDDGVTPLPYKHVIEEPEDNDGEVKNMKEEEKAGVFMTTINIIKNILGPGLLNFSVIIQKLGIVTGTIIIIFIGIIGYCTSVYLLECKDMTRKYGYSMYGKITLGKRGTILLKICLMLSNFGTCCFYFKILGGLSLSLVEMFFELKNQFYASPDFYMWVFFFLIGPLVFLTNINSLNNTAFIGVLSIIILFISIIILFTYKVMTLDIPAIDTKLVFFPNGNFLDLFACFASIFDSFTYKHNFFPIYLALRPRNNHSMKVATLSAIIFCIFLFSSLGILCFLMYGYDFVDIIDVFKKEILYYMKHNIYLCMLLVTVVVTYIIASVLTLPLVFFSVKKNCINLCIIAKKKYFTSEKEQNNNAEAEYTVTISGINPITDTTISQCSKHIITALLYTSVLVCTLYIKQIISISNAMGSTTSNAVMILFPCFFLIKLDGSGKKHYIPKFFLLFGFATLIVYFVTEGYKILRDAHLIHL